nr:MAG TPA: hypothetical protein [Bacteriophage sp.]
MAKVNKKAKIKKAAAETSQRLPFFDAILDFTVSCLC